ncbi:MAG: glycosyltransferase [Candidatus Lokiarchaeota archaeon]|nr:glycosyltransferase [Candidatus Lokiarchaeota archaeon]
MYNKFKDNIQVLCTNAVDFKGLKTEDGKFVSQDHPYYRKYRDIDITRFVSTTGVLNNSTLYGKEFIKLKVLCDSCQLNMNDNTLHYFISQGPVLNDNFKLILKKSENFKPDLIHATYLPYSVLLYSLILSKKLKIPCYCTPFYHIYNPRYEKEPIIDIMKNFDVIFSCTEVEKNFFIKHGLSSEKIYTIPMGVDIQLYSNPVLSKSGKKKSFCRVFGVDKPFIFYCGYKNHEKGAIDVLKAAKIIVKKNKNVNFVFIGPSTHSFDIELKKARKKGIKILNLTPSNLKGYFDWRKISAFQECSVFVMPSRSDAYGMVYLEAWAAKKAVIGARNEVMKSIIEDGKDGYLVEYNNPNQLAELILRLLSNPELADNLGNKGYQKIKNNNSWSKITNTIKEFYEKIIPRS